MRKSKHTSTISSNPGGNSSKSEIHMTALAVRREGGDITSVVSRKDSKVATFQEQTSLVKMLALDDNSNARGGSPLLTGVTNNVFWSARLQDLLPPAPAEMRLLSDDSTSTSQDEDAPSVSSTVTELSVCPEKQEMAQHIAADVAVTTFRSFAATVQVEHADQESPAKVQCDKDEKELWNHDGIANKGSFRSDETEKADNRGRPGPRSILRHKTIYSQHSSSWHSDRSVVSTAPTSRTNSAQSLVSHGEVDSVSNDIFPVAATAAVMGKDEDGFKAVSFNSKVAVRLFQRPRRERQCIWYSRSELDSFRQEAIRLMVEYNATQLIPTGTGRAISMHQPPPVSFGDVQQGGRFLFTHKALQCDQHPEEAVKSSEDDANANNEISKILLVDPTEICLKLMRSSFELLFPHASIVTASSGSQAVRQVTAETDGFDIIVVEERLRQQVDNGKVDRSQGRGCLGGGRRVSPAPQDALAVPAAPDYQTSGSSLLRKFMAQEYKPPCLYIGLTAHVDSQDKQRLFQHGGADLVWSKPPPKINHELRQSLVRKLMQKRSRDMFLRSIASPV